MLGRMELAFSLSMAYIHVDARFIIFLKSD